MSEGIIIAIIGGVAAIIAAIIGVAFKKKGKDKPQSGNSVSAGRDITNSTIIQNGQQHK